MKIHEIREMSNEEILKRIDEEEHNLVDLRFQHELKNLTNTAKLNLVKKDIAKMKTVLKQRELETELKENIKEGAAEN
ncbi:MAG: 50S ribosomal protein L29 [Bacteroidetes bacterium]|nr:50S ribosomal protein L29 [Bacteroidota bacterium]MBU1677414.1 50S ribosomal protein L29 [Bacteroidota bacterium]MBU2508295.1 50S ribosomal protein L29 [Bacteroidota bacterium]